MLLEYMTFAKASAQTWTATHNKQTKSICPPRFRQYTRMFAKFKVKGTFAKSQMICPLRFRLQITRVFAKFKAKTLFQIEKLYHLMNNTSGVAIYLFQKISANLESISFLRQSIDEFIMNLDQFAAVRQKLIYEIGPPAMPLRYVINVFKGLTFLYIIALMRLFDNHSSAIYLYLLLHGSYGIFWVYKDVYFGDKSFADTVPLFTIGVGAVVLSAYWVTAYLIATGEAIQEPSMLRALTAVSLYVAGLVLMIGSDYQKNTRLKLKPGLISDGFFARTRNPNYLGEMMIYGAFAAVGGHFLSYAILAIIWSSLFALNMVAKEISYRKKQGWEEYRTRSRVLFPYLLGAADYPIYVGMGCLLYQLA